MQVYKRECECLRSTLEALKSEDVNHALESEVAALSEKYLQTAKQLDRLESPSLARSAMEPRRQKDDGSEKAKVSEKEATKFDEATLSRLTTLEEEVAGTVALAAARETQLKKQGESLNKLHETIRALELQLVELPEEHLRKYKSVLYTEKLIQELTVDNTRLERDLSAANQKLTDLTAEQAAYQQKVRNDYEAQRAELQRRLDVCDADVARIRAARDDLLGELSIKKAGELERAKSADTLKELLANAEERIKLVERSGPPEVDTAECEGLSHEDLIEKVKKLVRQNKALAAEIPGLEQAFAKAHAKAVARTSSEQAATEAKINAINASKARADEKYFSAMRARDAMGAEIIKLKAALAKSAEVIATWKESEQKLINSVSRLQRQLGESKATASSRERASVQADRHRVHVESKLEAAKSQNEKLLDQLQQRDLDVSAGKSEIWKLEALVEKLTKQLETKRATSGAGTSEAVQEQIESLRSIALCSLCTKNWKDTAIKVCGHVFCHDCANARLAARMRKCPLCNSQFGQNDLLSVHL